MVPVTKRILGGLILAALVLRFAVNAGRMLVVNDPQKADAIVALAGETDYRPQLGLRLLDRGYGTKLLIGVPEGQKIYQYTQVQLARNYFASLPEAASIEVCQISGLSTRDEAHDVEKCLTSDEPRILIVTSDYHTRRALSIFRHELPGRSFSVAAAYDPREYGVDWWRHREWAKTCLDEWLKLVWWNGIDRWR
jgi:uncharacterized SAM-binding protein YcdF (DUF218 family)